MSRKYDKPFTPLGESVTFTAATPTAPAGIQAHVAEINDPKRGGSYRIVNTGTVSIWLGVGATAAEATANAVAAPGKGLLLLAGASEIFTFGRESFFSGISASGTAEVVIMQGEGS